jgi:hypothetical protein
MKILFGIACFFVMTAATAQTNNNPLWKKMIKENGRNQTWKYAMANVKEFDLKRMRGLCMYIGSKEKIEGRDGRYVWGYQREIFKAAGVDTLKDDETMIAKKISTMWNNNDELFACASTQFDVTYGSIIKYAINMMFEEFLIDMVQWKVNLNKVDDADNMTIMDYLQVQLERNKGLPSEPYLKGYYAMFKKAGAKHRVEL